MARCPFIAILAFAWGAAGIASPAGAGPPAEQLLARAAAARGTAERNLAEARRSILEQRTALAAELQQAYAALDAARAEAKSSQESLRRFRAESADVRRSAPGTAGVPWPDGEVASHRAEGLIVQAAASAGVSVGPSDPIDTVRRELWKGFQARLARLAGDLEVKVRPETIVARDGSEAGAPVLRVGAYAAYACGGARVTCGLLRLTRDGRSLVTGPYLSDMQAYALRAAADGKLAHLPLDVDGTMQDRSPGEPKSVRTWLAAGGLFIIPIIIVGAVGLMLVLERIGYLFLTKESPSLVTDTLACMGRRDLPGARKLLSTVRTPTARVLMAGIDARALPADQREAAMESALLAEGPRLERSLSLLGALAGVAPLLGLLGTVSGMIATFDTISAAGTGNPRLLSGGISEALITTQLGLVVAIPLLLAHAGLRRWVERREAMLEYNAVRVFGVSGEEGGQPA